MNTGQIINGIYYKKVRFSEAVLWKTKQLSLPPEVFSRVIQCRELRFTDDKKGETWVFSVPEVLKRYELKTEGQEMQYYFPIDLAKKIKLKGVSNNG